MQNGWEERAYQVNGREQEAGGGHAQDILGQQQGVKLVWSTKVKKGRSV